MYDRIGQLRIQPQAVPGTKPERRGASSSVPTNGGQHRSKARSIFDGDVGSQSLAGQKLGSDAEQTRGGFIGLADDPLEVGDDIGVGGQLEQLLVPRALRLYLDVCLYQLLVLLPQLFFGDPELLQSRTHALDISLRRSGVGMPEFVELLVRSLEF